MNYIYPDFDKFTNRKQKQAILNQKACVFWFTGLSGSGKSTIAAGLDNYLTRKGYTVAVLDGDNVRTGINKNLGFSAEDRDENIRRIAEVAKLFLQNGIIVICCFVSPLQKHRNHAKSIIGDSDFFEVFIDTPLAECEKRDVKGLYAKARAGQIKDFTGIHAPFEEPTQPALRVKTIEKTVAACIAEVCTFAESKIF